MKNTIIPGNGPRKKKVGVDSVQASALLMSSGYTDDPVEALDYDRDFTDKFDAEMRTSLRNRMGFDFKIKMKGSTLIAYSKSVRNRVRAETYVEPEDLDKYGNIVSEDLIGRLVTTCLELKRKWDAMEGEVYETIS